MYFLLRRPARGLTLSYGSAKQQAGKAILIGKAEKTLDGVDRHTFIYGGLKNENKKNKKRTLQKI